MFKSKVRAFYKDRLNKNDSAHTVEHADDVLGLALKINEAMHLGVPENHIALMAYMHDLFVKDREHHHELGFECVKTAKAFMGDVSQEERMKIAHAVLEHRASYKGKFFSIYSELLSTADRGAPVSVKEALFRSMNYARSKLELSRAGAIKHSFKHLKEKFGSKGYASFPDLYKNYWGEEFTTWQKQIDSLIIPSDERCEELGSLYVSQLIHEIDEDLKPVIKVTLRSRPNGPSDVFWEEDPILTEFFKNGLVLNDPAVAHLVKELDRRLAQLWDKVDFEKIN